MFSDTCSPTYDVAIADVLHDPRQAERRRRRVREERRAAPHDYRVKLGREVIRLSTVEFHILMFLAARPYHAYTPRHIVEAVSTDAHPLREETLDRHIARLREQLGFFRDLVQSVPYIGYRFKA